MSDMLQSGTDRMIYDFLRSTGLSPEPVVCFASNGTVMQNSSARRFSAEDLTAIQLAASDAPARGGRASAATSLGEVDLNVQRYAGRENCLVRITVRESEQPAESAEHARRAPALVGVSAEWDETVRAVERGRATSRPLVIAGETGSGKTSLAAGAAFGAAGSVPGVAVLDAGSFQVVGARLWFERVRGALEKSRILVLCNVDALDPRQLSGLRSMLRATPHQQRVAMTVTVSEVHEAEPLALMFGAHLIPVPALRERPDDIGGLWRAFAQRERPGATAFPDTAALAALGRYDWPGNLRELQTTVAHVLSRRPHGPVTVDDLPAHIRNSRSRGLLVKAEREAIHRALMATGGNRTRAAEMLGISRATIYRKAKSFGIPT